MIIPLSLVDILAGDSEELDNSDDDDDDTNLVIVIIIRIVEFFRISGQDVNQRQWDDHVIMTP